MAYTTVNKPTDYFNTVIYTGNGTTDNAITGVGFQPDLNWIKERSNAESHIVHHVGMSSGDYLRPDSIAGLSNSGEMTKSLDTDGFTLGTRGEVNQSSTDYVAWNWLADNTTGSSDTNGSITSTVSANTTSGFSIVKYTGTGANATVGHGLSTAPKFIMTKNLADESGYGWYCYHASRGATKSLYFHTTDAEVTGTDRWNDTAPTSTVFSVGTNGGTNASSTNMIAYCFSEVQGFSRIGQYTGNGNADGPFVYTGFKPAFVIGKKANSTEDWFMFDSTRDPYNPVHRLIYHRNAAEYTGVNPRHDFLSNGFKVKTTDGKENTSGAPYIFIAFAAEPLVGSNNVCATAR